YDASQTGPHRDWISTAWFDGYTPTLAGSIYIGYDQPDANHHMIDIPHTPSYNCAKIFGDIVRLAVAGQPPQTFAPSGPAQTTTARAVYGLAATWDPVAQAVQLTWQTDMSGTVAFQIRRSSTPLPGVSGGAAGGPGPGTGGAGPGGNGTAGTTGLAGGGTGAAGTGTPSGGIAGTGAALPGQAGTGANTAGGPGVGTGTTGAGASGTAAAGATSQVLGLTTQPSYTDAEVLPGYAYTYVVQAVNLQTQQPVGQPQSITVNVVAPGMVSSGGTGAGTAAGGAGTAGGGPGAGGTTPVPNPGSTGPGTPGNLAGTGQSGTGGSVGSGWGGAPGGTSGSQGGTNTAAGAPGAPAGPGEPWAPGGTAGTSGGTGTGTAPAGQTAESTTGMRSLPHSHRRP
ncbi:MAG: hypothetical protein K6T26_07870, partial [Alicyclobacillus sp.]|nr:hypothetical protein [Alicyclobacillus sp.]